MLNLAHVKRQSVVTDCGLAPPGDVRLTPSNPDKAKQRDPVYKLPVPLPAASYGRTIAETHAKRKKHVLPIGIQASLPFMATPVLRDPTTVTPQQQSSKPNHEYCQQRRK